MTIGKNNEAPAAYALTSTIKRLLDHLTESKLYSAKDLDHVSQTLESLENIIQNFYDLFRCTTSKDGILELETNHLFPLSIKTYSLQLACNADSCVVWSFHSRPR
jgi:hypothetical protein